jgi:hypothetical protein
MRRSGQVITMDCVVNRKGCQRLAKIALEERFQKSVASSNAQTTCFELSLELA